MNNLQPASILPAAQVRTFQLHVPRDAALQALEFPFAELVLIRHLRSLLNAARDCMRGKPNDDFLTSEAASHFLKTCPDAEGDISTEGAKQGIALTRALSLLFQNKRLTPPDVLVVSPFKRTVRTADCIEAACPVAPLRIVDARIRERGACQSILRKEDIDALDPRNEPNESLDTRTFDFFRDASIDPRFAGRRIWLVTHGQFAMRTFELLAQGQSDYPYCGDYPNGGMLVFRGGPKRIFGELRPFGINLVGPGFGGNFWANPDFPL